MTRLKNCDISDIPLNLEQYNQELLRKTGRTLFGIACHAYGQDEVKFKKQVQSRSIHVIPSTAGQGIITGFSETVAAILKFMGFKAIVSNNSDASGLFMAYENKADAAMMADDHRFAGINLRNQLLVDNSIATGRVFAAALDLMAQGIKNRKVLVLGCGPVGGAAAQTLLMLNARVSLFDKELSEANLLKKKLLSYSVLNHPYVKKTDIKKILIEEDIKTALLGHDYIVEATPATGTIPDTMIKSNKFIAAPGVPLGVSQKSCHILQDHIIHDKLELGVAAMAVSLFL